LNIDGLSSATWHESIVTYPSPGGNSGSMRGYLTPSCAQ
jgi:hypothetical protein